MGGWVTLAGPPHGPRPTEPPLILSLLPATERGTGLRDDGVRDDRDTAVLADGA